MALLWGVSGAEGNTDQGIHICLDDPLVTAGRSLCHTFAQLYMSLLSRAEPVLTTQLLEDSSLMKYYDYFVSVTAAQP